MFFSLIPQGESGQRIRCISYATALRTTPSDYCVPVSHLISDSDVQLASLEGMIRYNLHPGELVASYVYPFTAEPLNFRALLGKGIADRVQLLLATDFQANYPGYNIVELAHTPQRANQLRRLGLKVNSRYTTAEYYDRIREVVHS